MTQNFAYKARNPAGKLVTGKIEAENRSKAITQLRDRRFFVVELKEAPLAGTSIKLDKLFQKKVGSRDLAVMCRQFATMVQAGVPLLQTISIISQQCDNKTLQDTMKKVGGNLAGGMSLTESMKPYPRVFPGIFTSMVEAGEVGGDLEHVLERLAVNFEKEHDMREKVKSAMTYPTVVLVVAVLAVVALLIFVLPSMTKMLIDMKAPLPVTTKIIMGVSGFLKNYWYIALTLVVALAFGYKTGVKSGRGKKMKDSVVLKLPVMGPMVQKIVISRFCRSLSTLLKSGVPVLQALEVVKNIVDNHSVNMGLKEAERSIKEGQSFAEPLMKSRVFPPMVSTMMSIGEETGSVDTLLEKVADFYEKEVDAMVSRLSSMIEPILLVGMGVVVGFILISIMVPMFTVMDSVK
ncbi:putative type II secretion system protein F [Pelotomaculum sp. FP]|uniref:type II secretion system F family protein n=1 Tax=Pelotomaculum sp. FP TaxID=261474 RepID=UPI001066ACFA|nr:type II secretion system F family protein [Pelotomaculum sp. FP]TEB17575.1 putative type II secretion system protein F [Pelotomaculum sp. FP]